jgi:hypothetical protein
MQRSGNYPPTSRASKFVSDFVHDDDLQLIPMHRSVVIGVVRGLGLQ